MCALLAGAALVPGARAVPGLVVALAVTAGVFVCATAEHVVLREGWVVTVAGTVVTLAAAAWLLAGERRPQAVHAAG